MLVVRSTTTNRIKRRIEPQNASRKLTGKKYEKQHDDLARLFRCHENNLQGYEPELGKLMENERR